MAGKALSSVDTAWLRMEDPTNLMMITGVMIFGTPMDMERLKATVEHRLLRFDRFRQRVVAPRLPLGKYHWKEDARFDINNHIERISLPPPGDQQTLQEVVSHLMSTQLDFSKPLWELHLVEEYGDGCAVIARLHHCIADGIALVRVLLSLTDTDPDAPWPVGTPKEYEGRAGSLGTLFGPVRGALNATSQVTQTVLQEGQKILENPPYALELAGLGASTSTALGRLLLLWPDPKTAFKGQLGVAKRAVWSAPIPLAEVKATGRAMDGTVNDVLLTAVTGALRRYLQGRGEAVDGLNFRAVVPVNLRPMDEELTLGNKFGLVFLSLPVGIGDPVDRLRELKRRMDAIKGTPEAVVAFGILNAIGAAPSEIQEIVVNIFGTKGTGVMTNVPGPKETIYLAGAPLDTIMFWVPQSGRLGLGVSILSYAGRVWLGIATDRGLVPDPDKIIAEFHREFEALSELTRKEELVGQAPTPTPAETIEEMIAKLNAAVEKLERIAESSRAHSAAARQEARERCRASTKAGRPCQNRPSPGSVYCHVHKKQTAVAGQ